MNKSSSEICLTYERFIGYEFEQDGFVVRYRGATKKFKDKGVDLLATKGKTIYVIQCKHWKKSSSIGDATIRNLQGALDIVKLEYPKKNVSAILISSTSLFEDAKEQAALLNIKVIENHNICEYPKIKCNVSKSTNPDFFPLGIFLEKGSPVLE